LLTNRVLQGEFYYLLRRAGAGPKLARTGTNEQAGIGYIRSMKTVMAFALMAVTAGSARRPTRRSKRGRDAG